MAHINSSIRQEKLALASRMRQPKGKKGRVTFPLTRSIPLANFAENIFPPEMDVKLTSVYGLTISNAASSSINRFYSNSAYTPLVGASSGLTPGFSHWANFYGFYRVIAYSYDITFVNNQAFALDCFVLNTNNDPGTTASVQVQANPLTQHKTLSGAGGMDKVRFTKLLTIAHVAGTIAPETGETYRALINADPADLFWIGVGIKSVGGSTVTLGAACQVYLTQYVRFFDRLQQ